MSLGREKPHPLTTFYLSKQSSSDRSSCAPAGGHSGTQGRHSSGERRSSRRAKGLHWLQQQTLARLPLSPAVAVADSWEKEKGRKKKKILGSSRWKVSAKPPPNAAVPPKSSPSPDKAAAAAARASCTNSQRMLGRWLPGWVLVGVSCPSHPE